MKYILLWLLFINLSLFFAMGIDKRRARKNKWRVSERTLLVMGALGGAAGGILGMKVFRHKTLHKRFSIGYPAMLAAHIALFVFVSLKFYQVV